MPPYNTFNEEGLAPGVHIQDRGHPLPDGFKTGVPLFIGFGQSIGRDDDESLRRGPCRIFRFTRWEQFEPRIRVHRPDGYLDYAVRGFFENGGECCMVACLNGSAQGGYALARSLNALFAPIKGPLEEILETDLVCAPDIMMKAIRSLPGASRQAQQCLLEFCRRMGDRLAILDSDPLGREDRDKTIDMESLRRVLRFRHALTHGQASADTPRTKTRPVAEPVGGALYFPWLHVKPLPRHRSQRVVRVPPSGHMAGIYARSDSRVGVHKAPANEVVEGVEDLTVHLGEEDLAVLNQRGVNCLRSFPGRGIRVWGARTLSEQHDWQYINVRRLFVELVRWVDRHLKDVVFEPNAPPLWNRTRDRLGAYCYNLYNRGALKGSRPGDAFFVRCDAETNPPEIRSKGQLVCEIGLAPVVPAEFVVVQLTQSHAGTHAVPLSTP